MATTFRIDETLKDFIESGLACIVGTASDDGRPQIAYGWAPRVRADGKTVDVFIDQVRAKPMIANVTQNKRIAMTVAEPISYRSIQLKGQVLETSEDCNPDSEWVKNGREGFLVRTSLVGDDPAAVRNLWFDDVVRLTFEVEQGFDQTPGPGAGLPL